MRAYSLDLRERVLTALERGMSRAVAVSTFAVSLATIKRWLARRRAGQSLAPRQSPGRTHSIPATELPTLRARLEAAPDASLAAHMHWWNDAHPDRPVSHATIDRAIARLNWTRKKDPQRQRARRSIARGVPRAHPAARRRRLRDCRRVWQ